MEKPAAQRYKVYLARLKAKNNDDYQKKKKKRKKKRKRNRLQKLKNQKDSHKIFLEKNRLRKKLVYDAKNKI